jgi:hypothetical protein
MTKLEVYEYLRINDGWVAIDRDSILVRSALKYPNIFKIVNNDIYSKYHWIATIYIHKS